MADGYTLQVALEFFAIQFFAIQFLAIQFLAIQFLAIQFLVMEFDWNNPPFNLKSSVTIKEIEESFEDPFAVKLLPDSSRFAAQSRNFNLGVSAAGQGVFSIYRTNGKSIRVIFARPFESEEKYFYQRKVNQTMGSP